MRSSRRRSGSSASSVQAHTRHSRGAPFGALRFVSGASGADEARASCAFRLCRSGRPVPPGRASTNPFRLAELRPPYLACPRLARLAPAPPGFAFLQGHVLQIQRFGTAGSFGRGIPRGRRNATWGFASASFGKMHRGMPSSAKPLILPHIGSGFRSGAIPLQAALRRQRSVFAGMLRSVRTVRLPTSRDLA